MNWFCVIIFRPPEDKNITSTRISYIWILETRFLWQSIICNETLKVCLQKNQNLFAPVTPGDKNAPTCMFSEWSLSTLTGWVKIQKVVWICSRPSSIQELLLELRNIIIQYKTERRRCVIHAKWSYKTGVKIKTLSVPDTFKCIAQWKKHGLFTMS